MNFGCDLYVYEHVDGYYAIHVASSRYVGDIPPLDWSTPERLTETYREQNAFLAIATHEPIGLPCDGESFDESTPESAVARLRDLKALGYQFPDSVITDIASGN